MTRILLMNLKKIEGLLFQKSVSPRILINKNFKGSRKTEIGRKSLLFKGQMTLIESRLVINKDFHEEI